MRAACLPRRCRRLPARSLRASALAVVAGWHRPLAMRRAHRPPSCRRYSASFEGDGAITPSAKASAGPATRPCCSAAARPPKAHLVRCSASTAPRFRFNEGCPLAQPGRLSSCFRVIHLDADIGHGRNTDRVVLGGKSPKGYVPLKKKSDTRRGPQGCPLELPPERLGDIVLTRPDAMDLRRSLVDRHFATLRVVANPIDARNLDENAPHWFVLRPAAAGLPAIPPHGIHDKFAVRSLLFIEHKDCPIDPSCLESSQFWHVELDGFLQCHSRAVFAVRVDLCLNKADMTSEGARQRRVLPTGAEPLDL